MAKHKKTKNTNNTPTQDVTPAVDPLQESLQADEEFKNMLPDKKEVIQELETEYLNKKIGAGVDDDQNTLRIPFPDYGYDRYVTDIANWQKQRTTLGSDPGYFYFKVFFNFNTNYGLLGGVMSTIDGHTGAEVGTDLSSDNNANILRSTNTAFGYLSTLIDNYTVDQIPDKLLALTKFVTSLKDISLRTPWMIKSISGLNTINSVYVKDFDKERSITLGFTEDATDSRFGTLLDLYKFACFDQMNCREVIPVNLRKFEMSIMIYQMPLKYYHTKVLVSKDSATKQTASNFFKGLIGIGEDLTFDGLLDAKKTTIDAGGSSNFGDLMSFKLFTFMNCEIDTENINEYYVDGMSNELPFKLGNNGLKIRYDRVYEHRMNEWIEVMFGSDGFQFNNTIPEILKHHPMASSSFDALRVYTINSTDNSRAKNSFSQYRQRAEAMRNRWYGKKSIVDYTDLLIAKYYRPHGLTIPGSSMKDFYNNLVDMPGKKWSKLKDGMMNNYTNYKNTAKNIWETTKNIFNGVRI